MAARRAFRPFLPREQDDTLIDLITAMEQGKARLAAVQARAETAFHVSQVTAQRQLGVPRDELGRGVADQIALARRITPKQASSEHALRRILVTSMPRTTALLGAGKISEWGAHMVAANVVVLDDDDRATIDAEFEARLPKVTAGRASDITRARTMELDPKAAMAREHRAVSGRRVTLRPAVDRMSVLQAVLPVKEGVASFDALTRAAKAAKSAGDPRGKGQIMADTGDLTEVDGRRRLFRGEVRRFILMRDQRCRTPYCDAAIHDVDHAHRHADGGSTVIGNGVGHCQRFNLAKEMPGWTSALDRATDEAPGVLTIETPTGHRYTSTSPLLRRLHEGPDGTRSKILPNAPNAPQGAPNAPQGAPSEPDLPDQSDPQDRSAPHVQPNAQHRRVGEAPPNAAASG